MLRYKTKTRPGLVTLYDIHPGNGAGLFLQPWSLHNVSAKVRRPVTTDNFSEIVIGEHYSTGDKFSKWAAVNDRWLSRRRSAY